MGSRYALPWPPSYPSWQREPPLLLLTHPHPSDSSLLFLPPPRLQRGFNLFLLTPSSSLRRLRFCSALRASLHVRLSLTTCRTVPPCALLYPLLKQIFVLASSPCWITARPRFCSESCRTKKSDIPQIVADQTALSVISRLNPAPHRIGLNRFINVDRSHYTARTSASSDANSRQSDILTPYQLSLIRTFLPNPPTL